MQIPASDLDPASCISRLSDVLCSLHADFHSSDADLYPLDTNLPDAGVDAVAHQTAQRHLLTSYRECLALRGADPMEEALLCALLLEARTELLYSTPSYRRELQPLLDRSFSALDHLPAASFPLRHRLLHACYRHFPDETLLQEARAIEESSRKIG